MKIKVHIDGKDYEADYQADGVKSILDACDSAEVPLRRGCTNGYCGACKMTLVSGSVDYWDKGLRLPQKNQILTCSAFPISPIEIER